MALDLDENFGLIVRTENGELRHLNSGEVSVRQCDSESDRRVESIQA